MAVEASEDIFNKWLTKKLITFEIEDEVLASYISSVITTDDVDTDKKDVLKDIFHDLVQGVDVDALCTEILDEWSNCNGKDSNAPEKEQKFDIGHKVSLIMEKSVQPVLKPANRTVEEEKLREAILSRCTFVSSSEDDDDSDDRATASGTSHPISQNAKAVAQAERERRMKLKSESEQKKAQDKVNKEKQKQKQDERKEKERKRTQKQERRR
ncbi:coiled-coil domain-containing protein 43 [Trichonephila clavata]|uniref:Coiled-coil domain-containing protein 43 n=1 Tax=Trichonephila clavata TaxID=2740835 RepID=A0A8X6HLA6_TRICU|nr:coiled-coil domain-containing protein 43 [Trichonephila clavata]